MFGDGHVGAENMCVLHIHMFMVAACLEMDMWGQRICVCCIYTCLWGLHVWRWTCGGREYVCVAYTHVYGGCMFGDGHVGAEMSKGGGWFCFGSG